MTPLRSQVGLSALNFRVGAIQTAFGPFFTVYLTQKVWNQVDIGFSFSVGTAAALILQLPAGALIDAVHLKRVAIAVALLMTGLSALAVVTAPTEASVLVSRVLQAFAGCLLTPAIAALPLKLSGHDVFGERLGFNGRYASLGNAVAAAALGGIAYYVSKGAVFILTSPLIVPALATLLAFRRGDLVADDHPATHHPRVRKKSRHRPRHIFHDPTLHVFAVCILLFQFANAAMLPLAFNTVTESY